MRLWAFLQVRSADSLGVFRYASHPTNTPAFSRGLSMATEPLFSADQAIVELRSLASGQGGIITGVRTYVDSTVVAQLFAENPL
jgi:hypothetical protein